MGNATNKDGWLTIAVECLPGGGIITSPFHFAAGNHGNGVLALSTGIIGVATVGIGAAGGVAGIAARASGYKALGQIAARGAAQGAAEAVVLAAPLVVGGRKIMKKDQKDQKDQKENGRSERDIYEDCRKQLEEMKKRGTIDVSKLEAILKALKAIRPFQIFHLGNSLVRRVAYPKDTPQQPRNSYSKTMRLDFDSKVCVYVVTLVCNRSFFGQKDKNYWEGHGLWMYQKLSECASIAHLQDPQGSRYDRFCLVSLGWTDFCDIAYKYQLTSGHSGTLLQQFEQLSQNLQTHHNVTPVFVYAYCRPYWRDPGGPFWAEMDTNKFRENNMRASALKESHERFVHDWGHRAWREPLQHFQFCGGDPPIDLNGHLSAADVEKMGKLSMVYLLLTVVTKRIEELAQRT